MSLLQITNVSKDFGGVHALSGVNFEVEEGQIFGLIGPNGAGKTSLFNLISGIYPATSGTIVFEGKEITRWKPFQIARAGVGRTFQSVHIFAGMSVVENVLMGQSRYAQTGLLSLIPLVADRREADLRKSAYEMLEFLDLEAHADMSARELPYALQRRVELARALASRPKLVLLDEPAAGLNEEESRHLAHDVRRIRERGTTVLLIEHDMSVVMDVCERIVVLNFGEKIAEGSAAEVQQDPRVIEAYLGREESDEPAAARREPVS